MSVRYVRLFICDVPQVQKGAPVLLAAGVLLGDRESGRVLAQIKLQNISEKTIKAVYVRIQCMDAMNVALSEQAEAKYLGLNAGSGNFFGDRQPILLNDASIRSFTLRVTDVMFADGTAWHSANDETCLNIPAIPSTLNEEQLEQLSVETHLHCTTSLADWSDVKRCVCGQWNMEGNKVCVLCKLNFEKLATIATPKHLDANYAARKKQEAEEAEAARIRAEKQAEENRKAQEAREKERKHLQEQQEKELALRNAKRKKCVMILSAVAAVCVAVYLLTPSVFAPMVKYHNAAKLLDNGQYEEAMTAFEALGDYSDSKDRIEQAKADIAFEKGDYQVVCDIYDTLPEKYHNHAADLNTIYNDAVAQMDAGNYDVAIATFTGLGNYSDSTTQMNEAAYRKAGALAASGERETAKAIYKGLNDYSDSEEKYKQIVADEAYDEKNYIGAWTVYSSLPEQYQTHKADYEAMYTEAKDLLAAGNYDEAQAQFVSLGSYSDSPTMKLECQYQKAGSLTASGNYDTAIDLYDSLKDYKDSDTLLTKAKADKLYDAGSYAEAYDIYATLDAAYQTHAADYESMYVVATQALEAGDYDSAHDQFAALGYYSNSATMATECEYQKAGSLAANGDYDAAIALYSELEGYKDSATLLTQTKADKLYDAGSYAEAYDIYVTLDADHQPHAADYENMYASATQALEDGNYNSAYDQFVALGNYSDASAKAAQCNADRANALFEAEKYNEAAEAYASLGDEANAQLSAYRYAAQMAEKSEYKLAADAYFSIVNYEDSREQHYQMGLMAQSKGKLADACSILSEDIDYCDAKETIYQIGVTASDKQLYEVSVPCFTAVGAYKNAAMKLTMDTYAWGNQLYEQGDYDQSTEIFASMGDFSDAATRANEAAYAAAEASMNAGNYDDAEKRYEKLGTYRDSADKVLAARYATANERLESGHYASAKILFAALGNFENSESMVKECDYRPAKALYDSKSYAEALEAFSTYDLRNYKDVPVLISDCNYQLATAAMAEMDYETAASFFTAAGTYSDSAAQAAECKRLIAAQNGAAYEAESDYESAYTQYAQANETDKMSEMAYQVAMAKVTASDYSGAISWFEKAGYGYSDVNEQILSIGEYYYATQQYDEAEAVYVKVVDTGVAAQRLYELGQYYELTGDVEHAAKAYEEAGDYEEAKAAYVKLSSYKDADSKVVACDNKMAAKAALEEKFFVGNYVEFGTYPQTASGTDNTPIEWLVLACDGNKALLISHYGLGAQPYDTERWTNVTWETCALRTWLNSTFMNKAFTAEEQKSILITTVDNSSSQGSNEWHTSGGNNTQDQIFLLSYAEANQYLGVTYRNRNNTNARVNPTPYAKKQGAWMTSSSKTADGDNAGWWWLRSPGHSQNSAAYVNTDGSLYYSRVDSVPGCVRPALWVDLESYFFQ